MDWLQRIHAVCIQIMLIMCEQVTEAGLLQICGFCTFVLLISVLLRLDCRVAYATVVYKETSKF